MPELVEMKVFIPDDRIGDFYKTVGQWLNNDPRPKPETATQPNKPRTTERNNRRASKYAGFKNLFQKTDGNPITLTFNEIEEALGTNLPTSARHHKSWWSNSKTTTHARTWMEQGYATHGVDIQNETVTFQATNPT